MRGKKTKSSGSVKSIPKPPKFVRGRLNFNSVCPGCGQRVNKATGIVCHGCEGGHDVHTHMPATSRTGKRASQI